MSASKQGREGLSSDARAGEDQGRSSPLHNSGRNDAGQPHSERHLAAALLRTSCAGRANPDFYSFAYCKSFATYTFGVLSSGYFVTTDSGVQLANYNASSSFTPITAPNGDSLLAM